MQPLFDSTPIDASRTPVVRIDTGEAMADSRDIAAYFAKRHTEVLRAIRDLNCSPEFRERNFASFKIKDLTGESTSHVLMTKDGFTFLAMGFTGGRAGTFKERYIAAFNAMEAELRNRPMVDAATLLNDPAALRGLLAGYTEKVMALEAKVAEQQDDVEALDRIAHADGSLCVTDAAKTLQVPPKELFRYLRSHGWIYSRAGTPDIGYQSHIANGDLEHKVTTVLRADGSEKAATQVRVTSQGLAKLAKLLSSSARAA